MPYLVHVSGSQGSGKTTLLKLLRQGGIGPTWALKDLDDFSDVLFGSPLWQNKKSDSDRGAIYHTFMTKAANKFIEDHKDKNIVFVGLGLIFPGYVTEGTCPRGYGIKFSIPKGYQFVKLFMSVPTQKLLKQLFERDVQEPLRKGFTKIVKEGWRISFNAKVELQYRKCEIAWYKKNGYKFLTQAKIKIVIMTLACRELKSH